MSFEAFKARVGRREAMTQIGRGVAGLMLVACGRGAPPVTQGPATTRVPEVAAIPAPETPETVKAALAQLRDTLNPEFIARHPIVADSIKYDWAVHLDIGASASRESLSRFGRNDQGIRVIIYPRPDGLQEFSMSLPESRNPGYDPNNRNDNLRPDYT